ncbi:MAG TPA: anthranilate synthase component 1 [Candidatus Nanoarchaeia archaeon]|nr:anthranilate synthase component 1 [Candidatus Nanoarchaeia archaeon]
MINKQLYRELQESIKNSCNSRDRQLRVNEVNQHNCLYKNLEIGSVVPIVETLPFAINPVEYFAKLSDYGRKKNSLLFESASIVPKYGERSLGTSDPCLKIIGRGESFEITALNKAGIKFLDFLKNDFDFCDEVEYSKDYIKGKLKPKRENVSENERLKLKNHTDILRAIAFKFKPASKPFIPYCGLFGAISYDFIDQFEDLPKNEIDLLEDADYVFYFVDNLFMVDHKEQKTYFAANALVTKDFEEAYSECISKIQNYKELVNEKFDASKLNDNPNKSKIKFESDTTKEEFIEQVNKIKNHILAGDVYQCVISRTISTEFNGNAFDIYKKLKEVNPSPYMFYINNSDEIVLGASPEMNLRVEGDKEKIVEIRPIAGTKPRGIVNSKIDSDLDSRYEIELKTDAKEIAEHTMLVDLARNDIARISKPGTRYVDEPYTIEKYSHVQHLVSNVSGVLKDDLDALHAYLATMNMGTLSGAPKVEAMKLIRLYEKTKRGFYGGAVGYLTPSGDMDSAILIRSIRIKDKKAYVRVGSGIVHDSNPESEFVETERKARACLKAIEGV